MTQFEERFGFRILNGRKFARWLKSAIEEGIERGLSDDPDADDDDDDEAAGIRALVASSVALHRAKRFAAVQKNDAPPGGGLRYRGTVSERPLGDTFMPNDVVTDHSTLWFCKAETQSRPPGPDWQLMVKSAPRRTERGEDPGE